MFAGLFAVHANAMGDRPPEPDPACFASDILRVEMGGLRFDVPRDELSAPKAPEGKTLPKVGMPKGFPEICQKPEDSPIKLQKFSYAVYQHKNYPHCEANTSKDECSVYSFMAILNDLSHLTLERRKELVEMRNKERSDHFFLFHDTVHVKVKSRGCNCKRPLSSNERKQFKKAVMRLVDVSMNNYYVGKATQGEK